MNVVKYMKLPCNDHKPGQYGCYFATSHELAVSNQALARPCDGEGVSQDAPGFLPGVAQFPEPPYYLFLGPLY